MYPLLCGLEALGQARKTCLGVCSGADKSHPVNSGQGSSNGHTVSRASFAAQNHCRPGRCLLLATSEKLSQTSYADSFACITTCSARLSFSKSFIPRQSRANLLQRQVAYQSRANKHRRLSTQLRQTLLMPHALLTELARRQLALR